MKQVCSNCAICNLKIKGKLNKKEKVKLIIFNKPKARFVADLTDIPTDIKGNSPYLYLINIIDHFSKYVSSYLLSNKKGKTILDKIKSFITDVGNPDEFGFDNGKEFVNEDVTSYLLEQNIRIIKGKPYHPRSQGVCERIHRTIRKGLILYIFL